MPQETLGVKFSWACVANSMNWMKKRELDAIADLRMEFFKGCNRHSDVNEEFCVILS
nr:unnamed protein product [Callosobruchus chinensis]